MSADVEEIERQALELDRRARTRLAVRLLDSLEGVPDRRIERLWIREAERRVEEIRRRSVKLLAAGPVLRRAGKLVRKKTSGLASRKQSRSIR
jgi:hypothetical protein